MRATILAALATAAVLTVSACGSAGAARSTSLGGAASIAPADAVAFIAIDTNLSSGQWDAVDGLLKKFPARDELLAKLQKQFERTTKVSWETDVKPALGDELDIVVLPGPDKEYVGLTKSNDQAKLDALLKKLGDKSVQVDGWTAFADTQAALDVFTNALAKLSTDRMYRTATAKLAGGALVHAYANGIEAQKLLHALATPTEPERAVPFLWASADVTAEDGGLRLHAYSRDSVLENIQLQRRPVPTVPYTSHLVDEIPADALVVADFVVKPGQFQYGQVRLPKQLKELIGPTAADLAELDQVLGGETALYVRSGLLMPELTLVTQPADIQQATETLDGILKRLTRTDGFQFFHATLGGQLVVSTSRKGIADFRSAGPKLSGDSTFKDSQEAAGMPAATTGFAYADLAKAVPLVQAFGPLLGLKLPPALQGDLSALRTVTAFGTRDGQEQSLTVYLQVQ